MSHSTLSKVLKIISLVLDEGYKSDLNFKYKAQQYSKSTNVTIDEILNVAKKLNLITL